jgi:hypothetical protein
MILSYEALEALKMQFISKKNVPTAKVVAILDSHMRLQERNEKLRTKNSRLIGMITAVRKAIG